MSTMMYTLSLKKIINKIFLIFLSIIFASYIRINSLNNISTLLILYFLPFLFLYYIKIIKLIKINIIYSILLSFVIYCVLQDLYLENKILDGMFWWCILLMIYPFFQNQKKKNLYLSLKIFFIMSIVILFIDMIYRFYFNPYLVYTGFSIKGIKYNFYLYKFGLIGADTNTTGILSSLCFTASIIFNKKYKKTKYPLIFFLLTIFTFSRSAILTVIIITFLSLKIDKKILIMFGILGIIVVFLFVLHDGSGGTKIYILQEGIIKFFNFNLRDIFIGVVPEKARIGKYYPHLLTYTLLFYKGIIGFVLFFLFYFLLFLKVKMLRLLLITFFIEGLSFVPLSLQTLTYFIMIFYSIARTEKGRKNENILLL